MLARIAITWLYTSSWSAHMHGVGEAQGEWKNLQWGGGHSLLERGLLFSLCLLSVPCMYAALIRRWKVWKSTVSSLEPWLRSWSFPIVFFFFFPKPFPFIPFVKKWSTRSFPPVSEFWFLLKQCAKSFWLRCRSAWLFFQSGSWVHWWCQQTACPGEGRSAALFCIGTGFIVQLSCHSLGEQDLRAGGYLGGQKLCSRIDQ